MIYNRTQTDVDAAKLLRAKVQSGQTLTTAEITAIERGSCTVNTLNRIEAKQAELAGILNSYAYMVRIETNTDWQYGDIFTYQDHARLLDNLNKLKQAYYTYTSTPNAPAYMYGFKEANDIEKILVDIESMIASMESKFRECGTFECGEVNAN